MTMKNKIDLKDAKCSKLSFDAVVELKRAADKEISGFDIEAYTGAVVDRWWGKLAIAIDGIESKQQMPIFLDHNRGKIVGYSTDTKKDSSFRVGGVFSKKTDAAKEVVGLAEEGFPWQASIGVKPKTILELRENASMEVNGQELTGPAEVWLESEVIETSFTALGADGGTSVTVFSEIQEVADEATITTKRTIMDLAKLELAELQKQRPDLVKAIAEEATAGQDKEVLANAREEGAQEMLSGIKAKLELSIPGHEELANEMAFDPKVTEGDASKRLLGAVKSEREHLAEQFKKDAPPPAKQPGNNDEGDKGKKKFASLEDRCKAEWSSKPELHKEFERLETYIAAEQAEGKEE